MRRRFLVHTALLVCGLCPRGGAQQPLNNDGVATLRVQTRLVIEDVVVMDAEGNPVHGLPASAFHVLDNDVAQTVHDFSEGSPKPEGDVAPALPPGTFTNAAAGVAPTTEVLLIDTDDMELVDQMFLLGQLKKAIAAMPVDLPASLFTVHAGNAVPLLLSSTDHAAMVRIASDILPIQTHAVDNKFQNATNQLMSVAAYLQQVPGRKNLLWFAGEFPFVSSGENAERRVDYTLREHVMHQVQEALAESRICVYPVDVRGVVTHELSVAMPDDSLTKAGVSFNPRAVNAASQKNTALPSQGTTEIDRGSAMRMLAEATGGRAYFLNNLAQEIDQAFDLGKSAYTLSYVPTSYTANESFHNVRIAVDGSYSVSYRRGYLATCCGLAETEPRYKLVAGNKMLVDPNQRKPLVFQAQLFPQADSQHLTVQFTVPLDQLSMQPSNDGYTDTLLVTAYAYDASGRVENGKMQELRTDLTSAQYAEARDANKKVATRETLLISKSARYLALIVRDKQSQRTGSLVLQTRILDTLPKPPLR